MQTPRPESAPADLLAGRYQLRAPIGAGGMGTVFEAHDYLLKRRVAIKRVSPELEADPLARERLRREALAAAALDHPYICQIHEIARDVPFRLLQPTVLYWYGRALARKADVADRARGHAMVQAALEDFKSLDMVLHADLAEQWLRGVR